jgi:hypothetical protein
MGGRFLSPKTQGMLPQDLQSIAQDVLHEGKHLAVNGRAAGLLQQSHHADGLQEVQEVVQQCPFIQR